MTLMIYGSTISPFVRKVRVVLAEKGLDYKLDPVNPFAPPPEFLAISPLPRSATAICRSRTICRTPR